MKDTQEAIAQVTVQMNTLGIVWEEQSSHEQQPSGESSSTG